MNRLAYRSTSLKRNKLQLWNLFHSEIGKKKEQQGPGQGQDQAMMEQTIHEKETCDYCQHLLAYSDNNRLICTSNQCGAIYMNTIDHGAEWRYYGGEDGVDPTRCGLPTNPLLPESSFGCMFACKGKTSYEMKKIRQYAMYTNMPNKERRTYNEYQKITMHAQQSNLPKKIIDDAIMAHRRISKFNEKHRGLNKNGILSCSVSIACKKNGYPRTPKEISNMFCIDSSNATKGNKVGQSILNIIEEAMDEEDKTMFAKVQASDFIERFCSKLFINSELTKLCQFIARKIDREQLMIENTPQSVAAGVIFFVAHICNLYISKRDVRQATEVSEVTINKCFKKLKDMTQHLVPQSILDRFTITITIQDQNDDKSDDKSNDKSNDEDQEKEEKNDKEKEM